MVDCDVRLRISKAQHLNSLSDFITARGKSWFLAVLTTVLVVMAITPYLALQIKAISSSANVLLNDSNAAPIDIDLASTILLFIFAMFYGIRFAFDPKQRNGLVATMLGTIKVLTALSAAVDCIHVIQWTINHLPRRDF